MIALERLLVRAALALSVLAFAPAMLEPFNAPKAALLRILGLPLLAVTLVTAVRRLSPLRVTRATALDAAVVLWVAVAIVATVFGISPGLSLLGEIDQREGLLTTLALAGLYAAARRSHGDARARRGTLLVVAGAVTIAAFYGLLQRARLDPLDWDNLFTYASGGGAVVRPFATLGNPILLGAVAAAATGLLASLTGPWGFGAALLVANVAGATLSRGAWIATAAAIVTAPALAWSRRPGARRVVLFQSALALVALVLGALGGDAGMGRVRESLQSGSASISVRSEIARAAVALWRQHPLTGVGPDAFGLAFPAVQSPALWRQEWIGTPVHAHSAVLQILATLGALGVLAGAFVVAALLVALAARSRASGGGNEHAALTAALVALGVGALFNPIGLAGAALLFVGAALAACAVETEAPAVRRPTSRVAWGTLGVVAALAAWPVVAEMRALAAAGTAQGTMQALVALPVADREAASRRALAAAGVASASDSTEDALRRIECDAALARLRAAAAAGDTTAALGLARRAEAAARAALRLEPLRASNYQRLGNALAAAARLERAAYPGAARWEPLAASASAAFEQAERRAPSDALILTDHASAELSLGRGERALVPARRIVSLYPEAASGHALEAAAWLAMKRWIEARAALERARAGRWEPEDTSRREAVERMLATPAEPGAH